jgi:hypothetical protein
MDTLTLPSFSLPNTRVPQHANRNAIQLVLICILVGFAMGLLTAIGQHALSGHSGQHSLAKACSCS